MAMAHVAFEDHFTAHAARYAVAEPAPAPAPPALGGRGSAASAAADAGGAFASGTPSAHRNHGDIVSWADGSSTAATAATAGPARAGMRGAGALASTARTSGLRDVIAWQVRAPAARGRGARLSVR